MQQYLPRLGKVPVEDCMSFMACILSSAPCSGSATKALYDNLYLTCSGLGSNFSAAGISSPQVREHRKSLRPTCRQIELLPPESVSRISWSTRRESGGFWRREVPPPLHHIAPPIRLHMQRKSKTDLFVSFRQCGMVGAPCIWAARSPWKAAYLLEDANRTQVRCTV